MTPDLFLVRGLGLVMRLTLQGGQEYGVIHSGNFMEKQEEQRIFGVHNFLTCVEQLQRKLGLL